MASIRAFGVLGALGLLIGCGPSSGPDVGVADSAFIDGGNADAASMSADGSSALSDAREPDSGTVDAASIDAQLADAAADASDALPPGCGAEQCNRMDDDCDGNVDESSCGTCESFAHDGHVYLACSAPNLGVDYLALACEHIGPGYHAARFDTVSEVMAVDGHASGWIGYFRGLDHVFRSPAGSPLPEPPLFAAGTPALPNLNRNCVYLENGELRDADCTRQSRPFICEGEILSRGTPACVPTTEACDLDDDDCDGLIDESACGSCDAARFVGHDYLICSSPGTDWGSARRQCNTLSPGSDLAVLDSFDEGISLAQQASFTGLDIGYWVGHNDLDVEGQYLSVDGRELPLLWGIGEPNNLNGAQDCVAVFSGGFPGDINCANQFSFFCERTSVVGP